QAELGHDPAGGDAERRTLLRRQLEHAGRIQYRELRRAPDDETKVAGIVQLDDRELLEPAGGDRPHAGVEQRLQPFRRADEGALEPDRGAALEQRLADGAGRAVAGEYQRLRAVAALKFVFQRHEPVDVRGAEDREVLL